MTFDDLLRLETPAEVVAGPSVCALVIGDAAEDGAKALAEKRGMARIGSVARVVFGLPLHTAPHPILIASLNTERGARFSQLSLFGWIEDHFIDEPRAEVFGLTPYGEAPLAFLRDFDLDRPPEAYLALPNPPPGAGPERMFRRVGAVVIAAAGAAAETLEGDQAALAALEAVLPAATGAFLDALRADVAGGLALRQALRAYRKTTDPGIMAQCDGWRVLTRAAPCVREALPASAPG